MYQFFFGAFVALAVLCAIVHYLSRDQGSKATSEQENDPIFKRFQTNFLVIYIVAMGSDWLQGPYVYALYRAYGFDKEQIAQLFVVGFLSSMVFGTVVGGLADKYGRKRMCIAFGVLYAISCLTKLYNDFWILMVGRLLSGVATSLLFSSFESWMVHEHHRRNFTPESLSGTFSLSIFCNGLVAIVAGLVASFSAQQWGYVSPFMISLVCLLVVVVLVSVTWSENFGDSSIMPIQTFSNAINDMKEDPKIPILGLVQSLFEGAMYTFVFMWTPALQQENKVDEDLPFGLIFACFMVCIMIGSSFFRILISKRFGMEPEDIIRSMLFFASASLFVPFFTTNPYYLTISFLCFEVCCGIYFPAAGTLRGKIIPEHTRSAIMNFFRVPLNFLVVVVLLKIKTFQNATVFFLCGLWLTISFFLATWLRSLIQKSKTEEVLMLTESPKEVVESDQ
eukprot:TRINITY_DN2912_c0_g1_i5.p1 TRINITY_DN2912_c0_g1~~TRINITY_DN2912_c0_g1_i5.p1  ORF type:complete len:450 (-),score=150.21 TRINITY_DN2912_c0_g1_i5:137-1486(-)